MKKMNHLAKLLLIQSIAAIFFWSGLAAAQISIVATVNEHPITNYDVEQRAKFLEFATNIRINDENRDRVYEDALQLLIDDKLRLEEAKGMIPDVESTVLPEARNFMNQNFGAGNRSGAIILREAGIDPMTVQQKYTSDLAWSSYISGRFQERFSNIEIMIDEELARIRLSAAKPQIQLAEIVLAPGQSRDLTQTRALAAEIAAAVRKGASFAEIARQYSASGSASRGGNIGWVMVEKLPKAFRDELTGMKSGEVTDPILLDGAFYLLRHTGERKNGLVDSSQSRVWLARAILPVSADATDADRLEAAARVSRDTSDIADCDAMEALNSEYGSGAFARLDDMLVADMAPQMQQLIISLDSGKPSEPLAFAEGVASMMICRIMEPELQLPSRDEIRQIFFDRVFGSLSERQALKLRRTAVIERRDR
ncbi:MAG: peptidylprolyl isomerase [Rhodobiaceae bacterium]|jgi:peptidyl-prolyl cis-trans isomerase SurA